MWAHKEKRLQRREMKAVATDIHHLRQAAATAGSGHGTGSGRGSRKSASGSSERNSFSLLMTTSDIAAFMFSFPPTQIYQDQE